MKVECKNLERVLREQEPMELAALEAHAQDCAACRAELDAWNEISVAALTLQRREENPRLWAGIRARLQEEARIEEERNARWNFAALWHGSGARWQIAAAGVVVLLLLAVNFRVWNSRTEPGATPGQEAAAERRLLTDKALQETQTAETAYLQSIKNLEALAEPKLQKADASLAANYREKLLLLDAAIAECRRQAEGNKYNAHVQRQLTSLYQEKQQTLKEVLRED